MAVHAAVSLLQPGVALSCMPPTLPVLRSWLPPLGWCSGPSPDLGCRGWESGAQLGPAGQGRKDGERTVRLWMHVEGGEEVG